MDEIVGTLMTFQEAQIWKDNVGSQAKNLRVLIFDGYERQAWMALGYKNWTECIGAIAEEFGLSERHLWRLQVANEAEKLLTPGSVGEIPERQLRPLASLPSIAQAEVWQKAVETAPEGKITAAHVQSVVDDYRAEQANQSFVGNVYQPVEATMFSNKSMEYYTPKKYTQAVRDVLGAIDLDPASCKEAQENVKADRYYTQEQDGLSMDWSGRVFLNPPYCKEQGKSNQDTWSQRLVREYESGSVIEAVLLVKAALGYKWFERMFDLYPVCLCRERLSFVMEDGTDEGQSKQGTAFFYFGANPERFYKVFEKFGRVIPPSAVINEVLFHV